VLRNQIRHEQELLDGVSRDLDDKEADGGNLKKRQAGLQADLDDANATNADEKAARGKIRVRRRAEVGRRKTKMQEWAARLQPPAYCQLPII
jgi:hypothetical protein